MFQNFNSFLRSLGGTCDKTFRGHKHTRHPTKRHVSFGRGSFVKSTRNVLGQKLSTKILFPEKQHGKMKQIWCFAQHPHGKCCARNDFSCFFNVPYSVLISAHAVAFTLSKQQRDMSESLRPKGS